MPLGCSKKMLLALKRPTAGAKTRSYKRRRLEEPCKLLLERPSPATTPEEAAAIAECINDTQPLERHGFELLYNLRLKGINVARRDMLISDASYDTWTCNVLPDHGQAWSLLDMLIYNRELMMSEDERDAMVDFIAAEHLACRVVQDSLPSDVAGLVIAYIDPTCRQPAVAKDAWLTAPTDIQESIYKTLTLEQDGLVNTLDLRSNITAFEPHMLPDDVDVDMDENDDPLYEAARELVEQQFTARHRAYWHKLVNTLNKRADVFWARVSERL